MDFKIGLGQRIFQTLREIGHMSFLFYFGLVKHFLLLVKIL